MGTINHAKVRGYRQGVRERESGMVLAACPHSQRVGRELDLYKAWVFGWALGRGFFKADNNAD